MRNVHSVTGLLLITVASGCTTPQTTGSSSAVGSIEEPDISGPVPLVDAAEGRAFAKSSNRFAFELYDRIAGEHGNVAYSPASISLALTMTAAGAHGETADEMRKVLHLDGTTEDSAKSAGRLSAVLQDPSRPGSLRIANRLFGDGSVRFEQPFLDLTKDAFAAPLERLDFAGHAEEGRAHINDWVARTTNQRIQDLVPERGVDADTRLVLVNAVHFGGWQTPFEKYATRDAPFHAAGGATPDVPMMHETQAFPYATSDGLQALSLPYEGGKTSMLVLLPEKADGLPELESALTAEKVERIASTLVRTDVAVSLPKFEIARPTVRLGEALAKMGMPSAFDAADADFTGITNPPNANERVHLGEVFHKAFVKVDEDGTEAAAATAVATRKGAKPLDGQAFDADHPFLFLLRDDATGAILFMGRVDDPSSK